MHYIVDVIQSDMTNRLAAGLPFAIHNLSQCGMSAAGGQSATDSGGEVSARFDERLDDGEVPEDTSRVEHRLPLVVVEERHVLLDLGARTSFGVLSEHLFEIVLFQL